MDGVKVVKANETLTYRGARAFCSDPCEEGTVVRYLPVMY